MANDEKPGLSFESFFVNNYDNKILSSNLPEFFDSDSDQERQKAFLTHLKYISQNIESISINILKEKIWTKEEYEYIIQSELFRIFYPDEKLSSIFRRLLKPFDFDGDKWKNKLEEVKIKIIENQHPKFIICRLCPDPELTEESNIKITDEKCTESESDNPQKTRLNFCALTKQMEEVDTAFFELSDKESLSSEKTHSLLDILYKPYFYQISIDFPEEKSKEIISSPKWFFVPIYKFSETLRNKELYEGELSYAASPFEYQKILADWTERILLDENSFSSIFKSSNNSSCLRVLKDNYTVKVSKDKDIQSIFDQIFNDNIDKITLKIYRVGQANFVIGRINRNNEVSCFAFDLGYSIDSHFEKYNEDELGIYDTNILSACAKSLELVIISHWHQDHYKAVFTFDRDFFRSQTKWIAPFYNYITPNGEDYTANRLIAYLIKEDKILFVPKDFIGYKNPYNYILCRGNVHTGDLNVDSLILQLNKTLLPGDSVCKFWPLKILGSSSSISNIIIPHHGSATNNHDTLNILKKKFTGNPDKAIVCVSKHSKDNLPKKDILNSYNKNGRGFEVVITCDQDDEIIIIDK